MITASSDPNELVDNFLKKELWHLLPSLELKSEVAIESNQVAQNFFLLEVKTITKSPGNGICESVKSCNLDKKGRIIWF